MRIFILIILICLLLDVSSWRRRRRRRRRSCYRTNGGWSSWSSWGTCSCNHALGTGTWTRYRYCNNPSPSCGGSYCYGSSSETGRCDSQCCRRTNGGWSSWGSWSTCSCNHALGTGTWTRSRSCSSPSPSCGGSSCSGSSSMTGSCDSQCCRTVHGGFSDWSSWGTCSCNHADGTGTRSRSRSCTNPAPSCHGNTCSGSTTDRGSCDDQCCQTVHGGLTEWGDWGTCTCDHSAGTGTWSRTRSCTNPAPSCHGNACSGSTTDTGSCDDQCCLTVHGGLTEWGNWGTCTCDHSTGTGTWRRSRSCTNPAPFCYGRDCAGDLEEDGRCDDQCCLTVHGGLTEWGDWGTCECDHSTGTGTWSRSRSCTNPTPFCYGRDCEGELVDVGNCDDQCCQTVHGGLTEWGDWGTCTCDHSTGTGTWNRTRSCTNPAPSCYGRECVGDLVEHGTCDSLCCQTVDGGWTDWEYWSTCECDHSTGTGTWNRSRSCTNPAPSCYGSECLGNDTEHGTCHHLCCKTVDGGWTDWGNWSTCECDHSTGTGTWNRSRSCTNPTPSCFGHLCDGAEVDNGTCDDQCCLTVNGGWTDWGNWSTCECDHSTGTGTWNRTRSCINPAPSCYGSDCEGEKHNNGSCDDQCCQTVDGGWTDWGNWSTCECDHSTGTGTWNKTRSCTSPSPYCYGSECEGETLKNGTCDDQCCQTVNGGWTDWGNWSTCECDHSTGTGTWNRTRSCTNPAPSCYGSYCEGEKLNNGTCDDQCCLTVNGGWTDWGNWSTCECDHSTGTGTWNRTRSCTNPVPSCYGSDCKGEPTDNGTCNDQCCLTVNGGWTDWGNWSSCDCDHSTGTGTWNRTRSCTNPAPSCYGSDCEGERGSNGTCDDQCCQTVDGGWTDWGNWSTCDCDHSTGTGTWNRTRSCTNPAPLCHGSECQGERVYNGSCDDQCCKTVDGGWTDWGNWSTCECDHSTGTGTWNRTRSCTNPAPFCYGSDCKGDKLNNGTCDDQCCKTVNGGWTDWGNWSTCECDHSTGTGTWNRTRSCSNPVPYCFGNECGGEKVDNGTCDDQCCLTVNGGWTNWGNWSTCDCDHSTGTGTWNRTRSCTNPAPSCYGRDCDGAASELGSCNELCCLQVDGLWSEWGNWSQCDCNNITATPNRIRTRTCTDPSPSCHGRICEGMDSQQSSCAAHCKSILPGLFAADGPFGLSRNLIIIISCAVVVLAVAVVVTAAMKHSERRKREREAENADENSEDLLGHVTDFHFESPSQGTMELDIESKVGPSVETEELTNDYIDYKGVAEEDDYIDYSGF